MMPPVGKSGPFTIFSSSAGADSGWSMTKVIASQISPRLWGGTSVAMPTAIPEQPLMSRLGTTLGSTVGSSRVSS